MTSLVQLAWKDVTISLLKLMLGVGEKVLLPMNCGYVSLKWSCTYIENEIAHLTEEITLFTLAKELFLELQALEMPKMRRKDEKYHY